MSIESVCVCGQSNDCCRMKHSFEVIRHWPDQRNENERRFCSSCELFKRHVSIFPFYFVHCLSCVFCFWFLPTVRILWWAAQVTTVNLCAVQATKSLYKRDCSASQFDSQDLIWSAFVLFGLVSLCRSTKTNIRGHSCCTSISFANVKYEQVDGRQKIGRILRCVIFKLGRHAMSIIAENVVCNQIRLTRLIVGAYQK